MENVIQQYVLIIKLTDKFMKRKFEDTQGVNRSHKAKTNIQHKNSQNKTKIRTNNDLQNNIQKP